MGAPRKYPTSCVAVINGVTYPKSAWASNDFWGDLEINLDGDCTTLRGTAGLTNNSDSGSQGSFSVRRDGSEVYANTFTMTTTAALDLDIAGTLRLAFNMETLTGSTFPYVGVGDARVYCKN